MGSDSVAVISYHAPKQKNIRQLANRAELRRARYRGLKTFWRFGRGWLARVDATEQLAAKILKTNLAKGPTAMDQGFGFPIPGEQPAAAQKDGGGQGKWWPQSKTVWGALITAVTTVLPLIGPLIGINISADLIKLLGDQTVAVVQALGGLVGTLLTLYGRVTASAPLVRQVVNVKV